MWLETSFYFPRLIDYCITWVYLLQIPHIFWQVMSFLQKDLPKLEQFTTTTTTDTTSTSIETTKTSNVVVSTSTVYIAPITPPSANNNPFIYHTGSLPNGTVFIAVGSVVGAIFLTIFVCWCLSTYTSYRNTKEVNNHNSFYYSVEKHPLNNSIDRHRIISDSSSMGKLSREDYEPEEKYFKGYDDLESRPHEEDTTTSINLDQQQQQQQPFSVIHSDMGCRNSLFISPTLQLAQRTAEDVTMYHTPTKNTRSNQEMLLDKPTLTASPERINRHLRSKHRRNQSSLGRLSASPSKSQIDLSGQHHHNKSASMYLEDILDSNK